MEATDGYSFTGASTTQVLGRLKGGLYGVAAVGTWGGGSATLQLLGPDGSTYLTVLTAFTANGYGTAYLPAGQYQVAIATATGVSVAVSRIPI